MRIVIAGAGPAGVAAAARLAPHHEVTLIGEEPGAPYNRVALSSWLADEVAADGFALPLAGSVTYAGGCPVSAIDTAARTVTAGAATIGYDTLILATGASAIRLRVPGGDLPHVYGYRTRADVAALLDHATSGGDAVVIGGGLLGLEAATGLAARGMRVSVLHAAARVMERQLDGIGAGLLARRLAARGITIVTGGYTSAITADAVHLTDGRSLSARLVVMAVGIVPRVELARAAGIAVRRGIVVDTAMRTSAPDVYAVGECAEHNGVCCGLVAPARAMAEAAAAAILGEDAPYRPQADSAALKIAGERVWSGGAIAGADEIVLREAGAYRKLVIAGGALVGVVMVGETDDAAFYHAMIRDAVPIGAGRAALPFGAAFAA